MKEPPWLGPALLATRCDGEVLWAEQVQAPDQLGQLMAAVAAALSTCGERAHLARLQQVSLSSREYVTCLASNCDRVAGTHRWQKGTATQATQATQAALTLEGMKGFNSPAAPAAQGPDSTTVVDEASHVDPLLQLLQALSLGDLAEAKERLAYLQAAHDKQGPFVEGSRITDQSLATLQLLVEAAELVTGDDVTPGLKTLVRLSADDRCSQAVQWTARLWAARGAVRRGEASRALIIARDAHARAMSLSPSAQLTSECVLAEALALGGSADVALPMARDIQTRVRQTADSATLARASLLEATIVSQHGELDQALATALVARRANPHNQEASLVMARLTLLKGQAVNLEELLANTSCHEASWLLALSHQLRTGALSREDIALLLDLLVQPSTPQGLERLCELSKQPPMAAAALELLAIRLLRLGRYGECQATCARLSRFRCRQKAAEAISEELPAGAEARRNDSGARQLPTLAIHEEPSRSAGADPGETIFSGDLGQLALAEVLEFLRAGRRSGTLYCRASGNTGILILRGGRLTSAQYLSQTQTETRPAVRGASPESPDGAPKSLGDLEQQAISVVSRLISWTGGQFGFEPLAAAAETAEEQNPITVDCQFVLLEVYRKLDEASSAEGQDEAVGA